MKKITSITILLVLIMTACEKEVKIPIKFTTPKLVVNALFNTDSLWDVEISASRYIYDTNSIPLINDAEVTISDSEGNIFSLTNYGDGNYHSVSEKPEIEKEYTIVVKHDDYVDVRATSQLPGELIVDNIDWHDQIYIGGDLFRKINVTFQDSQGKDYYLVRMSGAFWEEAIDIVSGLLDTVLVVYPMYFFSKNAAVEEINSNSLQTSISFTDDIFNGSTYTIDLLLYEFYFGNIYEESKLESIYISISRISEEYFLYEKSYKKYTSTNENSMFAQPTQVYTNIENGLGVFAGYSSCVDTINVN